MSESISPEENQAMLKWLHRNRRMLLARYKNQYVAYNADRLIAHSENLREVLQTAEASGEPFTIYLVPRRSASIQILPIHFRTVARHDWSPDYNVKLTHKEIELSTTMLVDSGAEVSLISLNLKFPKFLSKLTKSL